MSDIAEDFQAQSADQQILGEGASDALPGSTGPEYPSYENGVVRVKENQYTMADRQYPGLYNTQQMKENKSQHTLVARSVMTPDLNRSFSELQDQATSVEYISALVGIDRGYANRNLNEIIQRLYPNVPPSASKFVENIRATANQASLIRDLNFLYGRQSRGDTSSFTAQEIAARQLQLMNMGDLEKIIPAGFGSGAESAAYSAVTQLNMYRDVVPRALWGTAKGAAVAAGMTILTGGLGVPIALGPSLGGTLSTQTATGQMLRTTGVPLKRLLSFGTTPFRLKGSFDYYYEQNRGANWNEMTERLMAEDIGFNAAGVAQAASIIGAIEAAVQLVELEGFGRMFKGQKVFSNAFYEISASEKFLGAFANGIRGRIQGMPGLMGQEVASELAEELLGTFLTEAYMRRQGADPIDISMEEVLSQMALITRDTLTNTAIFGLGFGVGGALFDASVYTGQRKLHGIEGMSRRDRDLLSDLPTMEGLDMRPVEGTDSIDLSHVSDEDIRLNGQKLYESSKVNPMMPAFMSPAQRLILKEYIVKESQNAALTDAIEAITGNVLSELNGLVGFQYESKLTPLENASNFHLRVLNAGDNIMLDGTPIRFEMETGVAAELRITTDDDNITIHVNQGGEGGQTGVIHGKANTAGGMDISSVESTEFDSPADIESILYTAIPKTYLFSDESVLTPEDQTLIKEQRKVRTKEPSSLSKAELETSLETTKLIEDSNIPVETPPEAKTYHKQVPVVRTVDQAYWEEVDISEEVPVGDETVVIEPAVSAVMPEEEVVPSERSSSRRGIDRAKEMLNKFQQIYSDMEQSNLDAASMGETFPHNLEDTQRKIDEFEKTIEELEAQAQATQETYDVLNFSNTTPVEEDVAFSDGVTADLARANKLRVRMIGKGIPLEAADTRYRMTLLEKLDITQERLTQRRVENKIAIRLGQPVPYNVSSLVDLRTTIDQALGIDLKETTTDIMRLVQELQGSEMRKLDLIQESINLVFDKYNKDPAYKEKKGLSRKAAIVEAHRAELNVEALRRYQGRKITSQNLVELNFDRVQFYSSIQEMNDTGVVRNARMLSPEEHVVGIISPAETIHTGQETETEISREETERDTEQRVQKQSVRKTRKVKTLVMEDQVFSRSSNPEATTRMHMLMQETIAQRDFAESALDHMNAQIATIRAIAESVKTTKAHKMLQEIGLDLLVNVYGEDQSGTMNQVGPEGSTDLEKQRFAESMRKTLDKLPMAELDQIYKQVLEIGKLDIRLGGYRIGDYTMSPSAIGNIIARETSTTPMYGKNGEKIRGDFNKGFFRLYDSTLNYSTLIEKVRGRESLFFKVFYQDIQDMWLARERFNLGFANEFGAQFNTLPGIAKPNEYYSQVMATFGKFDLNKDKLISLLQHKRAEYNWKVAVENGLSVPSDKNTFVPIGMETTAEIVEFVEKYQITEADQAAMDIYQAGMDRLFGLANMHSLQVNGVPLQRDEFYMRVRPEFMELEGKQLFLDATDGKTALWSDVSQVKERMGTNKALRLVGAGYEFDQSMKNISNQFFMATPFTRAETLMNNTAVKNSMNNRFHKEFFSKVRDGLERWRGKTFQDDLFSQIVDGARQNFVASSLGINLEVAVMQTFSLPLYLTMVDSKYLVEAMYEANLHPNRVDDTLNAWSTQYLIRNSAGQIDIKEGREDPKNRFTRGLRTMKEVAFIPIRKADRFTVRMGSLAAFKQVLSEIEEGHFSDMVKSALDLDDDMIPMMTPEVQKQLAGKYADYVMERTQPSSQEQHMSEFQRKNSFTRTFSTFSGFTNQLNNLYYRMGIDWARGTPGAGKAFAITMFTGAMLLPAMTGIFNAGRGRLHDFFKDEDERDQDPFLKEFLTNYVHALFGSWFIIRDIERYVDGIIKRSINANNIVDIPVFEIGELYIRGAVQMFNGLNPNNTDEVRENNLNHAWKNISRALAYTFGIPFTPMRVYDELMQRSEN